LKTYQSERRRVVQDLIAFDHRFSRLFSERPAKHVMDQKGINVEDFKDVFLKGNMFASGISVDYGASVIFAKEGDSKEQGDGTEVFGQDKHRISSKQELATNVKLGMRMSSFKVLNQADAQPWHFQEQLRSNGDWRVVVFPGDVTNTAQMNKLKASGRELGAKNSFLKRFTPPGEQYDSVIEVLTVHSSPRQVVSIFDFPEALRP
jgi:phenol 2-monooxygenase